MPRNATRATEPQGLEPRQLTAIESLLTGSTITDAATAAGVDRGTVHRWLKDDLDFQATLNGRRAALYQEFSDRLAGLAPRAIDVLAGALDMGDVKAAVSILKGLGLLSGERPPTGEKSRTALQLAQLLD